MPEDKIFDDEMMNEMLMNPDLYGLLDEDMEEDMDEDDIDDDD